MMSRVLWVALPRKGIRSGEVRIGSARAQLPQRMPSTLKTIVISPSPNAAVTPIVATPNSTNTALPEPSSWYISSLPPYEFSNHIAIGSSA